MRDEELNPVEVLRSLARLNSPDVVQSTIQELGLRPEDISEGFQRLDLDEQLAVLRQVDMLTAANVMVELPTETARGLIDELPDETVALYLDILPPDDAVDLSEELTPERFEGLLQIIPVEDAQEIRRLMAYPEDAVGRMVTEKFFEVAPDMTVADILTLIRRAPEDKYETVNDIYVLDEGRHLIGVFSLRKALRSDLDAPAREIMRDEVVTAAAHDSPEDAARTMARYGFYALPVLDKRGRMVGIFTGDDAQTILREAESEDVLKMGGVSGDVEAYLSLRIIDLIKRRLPWLGILFVAEFFTGTVLRHYTGTSTDGGKTVLANLMVFIPLLIGAGGNTGSQVTTTITRALAVGDVRPRDALAVLHRELVVAIAIGATLGSVGYLRALMWGAGQGIGLTVACALPAIILWAALIGSLLPLGAKRLGIDPAVMSAPFITTFVDATGLIIYFEIARLAVGF